MFDAAFFEANRAALRALVPEGVIVLSANGMLQKNADESFLFRQDSTFWYFTGCQVPDAVLVITEAGEPGIILPARHAHRDQWDGAIDIQALAIGSGIERIMPHKAGWIWLAEQLRHRGTVASLPVVSHRLHAVYGMWPNPARKRMLQRIKRIAPTAKQHNIRESIAGLRAIKQPVELVAIKQAISHTIHGLQAVAAARPTLQTERQAQITLEHEFLWSGSDGVGFDSIVASGANMATVHYRDNRAPLQAADMLLIDAGARVGYYTADLSRTYAPTAGMTAEQEGYFSAVQAVKRYAESLIRPGVAAREYEAAVHSCMAGQLVNLGILKKPSETLARHYYPHLTSHLLGLDVHDMTPEELVFAEGMVLTIEPGIYNAAAGIGVRIEDNYVVTATGITNLSADLPELL